MYICRNIYVCIWGGNSIGFLWLSMSRRNKVRNTFWDWIHIPTHSACPHTHSTAEKLSMWMKIKHKCVCVSSFHRWHDSVYVKDYLRVLSNYFHLKNENVLLTQNHQNWTTRHLETTRTEISTIQKEKFLLKRDYASIVVLRC